jgi:hypothetical protein
VRCFILSTASITEVMVTGYIWDRCKLLKPVAACNEYRQGIHTDRA